MLQLTHPLMPSYHPEKPTVKQRVQPRYASILSPSISWTLCAPSLPLLPLPLLWRKYLLPDIQPFLLVRRQQGLFRLPESERKDLADPCAQHLEGKGRFPVPEGKADTIPVDSDHSSVHLVDKKNVMSNPASSMRGLDRG